MVWSSGRPSHPHLAHGGRRASRQPAARADVPIALHCETEESQRADRAQLLMLTLATAGGDLIAPAIRDALLLYLGDGTGLHETRQAEAS